MRYEVNFQMETEKEILRDRTDTLRVTATIQIASQIRRKDFITICGHEFGVTGVVHDLSKRITVVDAEWQEGMWGQEETVDIAKEIAAATQGRIIAEDCDEVMKLMIQQANDSLQSCN